MTAAAQSTDLSPKVDMEESLSNQDNVMKYQAAAEAVHGALRKVIAAVVAGAKIADLCALGDKSLLEHTSYVYNKSKNGQKIPKGIAFPTTVNVNHILCHFAPLASDPEGEIVLKDGDVVKIEMGAHIDGFPAMVGGTVVVGASKSAPVTGKKADIIQAAHTASEAALRLLRPSKTNKDVTDTIQQIVVDEFKCIPVEGILSSELKRTVLDGGKQIVINPTENQRREFPVTHFALGEIYSIDVLVSSSPDGKAKASSTRCTIYKRLHDVNYQLKMQSSRQLFSEIGQKCGYMPFALSNLEDPKKARMGVVECVKAGLLSPYSVLQEKEGEYTAQFLFTALLMPSGSIMKLTSFPFDQDCVKSEFSVKSPDLQKILTSSTKAPKKK